MERLVGHLLPPQIPWYRLLAQYLTATARDDYNWTRPSRREGDAILPSLMSNELKVIVGLDTSGSISDPEMQQFVSELDALKGQVNARITLLACDTTLAQDGPWITEPWEAFRLPRQFRGGGGTDFNPVFDWIRQNDRQADLLIYFTDAQGQFPTSDPEIQVIWLVKGQARVPWGQRIQLN